MKGSFKGPACAISSSGIALFATIAVALAQNAPPPPNGSSPAGKTAVQQFKNITVLKDIPANQLIPAMQFISSSLGVRCDYCHVEHHFDKDDKLPKRKARDMMKMMFAINNEDFKGHRDVTCNTCHNGAARPASIPAISDHPPQQEMAGMMPGGGAQSVSVPNANQILDKAIQAMGGEEAIGKVTSRVEKGTLSGFGPNSFPIEISAKAPDKRMSVMQTPRGQNITAFDGSNGWMGDGVHPPRVMEGGDLDGAKLEADFAFPADARKVFNFLRIGKPEKIGDQQTYLLLGMRRGMPPVRLYFDQQSGLLVREVQYTDTPLGLNPVQTDFADYRTVDGVKIPFKWTIARPMGRFTIQVDSVQQNVPVDDSKFTMPAVKTAANPQ
jgi:photosynthetic reaction center cytochrome c subunit